MDLELIKIIIGASTPVAITLILWRSGTLSAFNSRIKKNGDDNRISNIQNWKDKVEKNHFHDLEDLKIDTRELKKDVKDINNRLIVVETKINNIK